MLFLNLVEKPVKEICETTRVSCLTHDDALSASCAVSLKRIADILEELLILQQGKDSHVQH